MFIYLTLLGIAVVGVAYWLHRTYGIHWTGYGAIAIIALLIPAPVYAITTSIAKNDQQTFHEYWNGYETKAYLEANTCTRDGICHHEYDCDPYTVVELETYTDGDGDVQTRMVTKTKWHSCPYSTQETSYYVDSTLDRFTVLANAMTGEPFRTNQSIPGGQVTSPPRLWSDAKARIEAGNPSGVTQVNPYKNYLLASERTVFKRHSDAIDTLLEKKLLPTPASGIANVYQTPKVKFVGTLSRLDRDALIESVHYLNGAVGEELRGDFHAVFVDAKLIDLSSEDYGNALMAYWQSSDTFGRDAIAKNAVVLVVGVEGYKKPAPSKVEEEQVEDADGSPVTPETILDKLIPDTTQTEKMIPTGTPIVSWAKAYTGMPLGNEALLTEFASKLPGAVIDKSFFGSPTYDIAKEKIIRTNGVVEGILFGANKFERVSMSSLEDDDNGTGFAYLSEEWEPDAGTLIWFYVISSVLFIAALFGAAIASMFFLDNRYKDPVLQLLSPRKGRNE